MSFISKVWIEIKNVFNWPSDSFPGEGSQVPIDEYKKKIEELEQRRKMVAKRELSNVPILEWFRIESLDNENDEKLFVIFCPKQNTQLPTIKGLREERLLKEAHELKQLEDEVRQQLDFAEKQIAGREAKNAELILLNILGEKLAQVKDKSIREKFRVVQSQLSILKSELERERLAREAAEKRRKEAEAKKIREAAEKERKAREEEKRKAREKREAEAARLAQIARVKEEAEMQERQRLYALSHDKKEDWQDYKCILDANGIKYLYHFTDVRNISSIKAHGGLFSWYYCHTHDIAIPCQGGDYDSQELDKKYGLEDYVRLSFCDDHPMAHRLEKEGCNIKTLKIKAEVAFLKDVQFSDINAADGQHEHGKTLAHLQNVDFEATKMHYVKRNDPNFKPHQAEVMIKTFVPLEYIVNL